MKTVAIHASKVAKAKTRKPNVFHTLHFDSAACKSNYNSTPHDDITAATIAAKSNSNYPDFIIIEVDPN